MVGNPSAFTYIDHDAALLPAVTSDDADATLRAWVGLVIFHILKLLAISQATGIARLCTGTLAAPEDAELLRATYGPASELSRKHPTIRRLKAVHRNELENVTPFLVLSYAYCQHTAPRAHEAIALMAIFTLARAGHNVAYLLALAPWRSVLWGAGAQATLLIAGRCAAWLFPSAAVLVQVVINAPLLLQWMVGLGMLASVREQRRRYDMITRCDEGVPEGGPLNVAQMMDESLSDEG